MILELPPELSSASLLTSGTADIGILEPTNNVNRASATTAPTASIQLRNDWLSMPPAGGVKRRGILDPRRHYLVLAAPYLRLLMPDDVGSVVCHSTYYEDDTSTLDKPALTSD